jgi:hypothetical protein
VLLTGALDGDPYGGTSAAHVELGSGPSRPVALREPSAAPHHAATGRATFDNRFGEWLRTPVSTPAPAKDATVLREPLPIEFAREPELLTATSKHAAATRAGLEAATPPKHAARVSIHDFGKGRFRILVNESSTDDDVDVPSASGVDRVRLEAGRAHLGFVTRRRNSDPRDRPPRAPETEPRPGRDV